MAVQHNLVRSVIYTVHETYDQEVQAVSFNNTDVPHMAPKSTSLCA